MTRPSDREYLVGVLEQARLEIENNRWAVSPWWEVYLTEGSVKATLHFWFDNIPLQFTYAFSSPRAITPDEVVDMFTASLHDYLTSIAHDVPDNL